MKQKFNDRPFLFLLLLCLLQPRIIYSAYYNGYNMIRDIYDDSTFATDAAQWTIVGGEINNPAWEYCSTTLLLGGSCVLGCSGCSQIGDYFQRVYTNLPPHNSIRYVLTFWAIDSWDLNQEGHNDGFELYFDGTVLDGWYMSLSTFPQQLCGVMTNSWNELPNLRIFGTIPHTASSITFRVLADLNEDSCNESFGFRDISFIFDQNTDTQGTTMCGTAPIVLPNKNCACAEGYYSTGSGCAKCNTYCSSCFGPSATDCYACLQSPSITYDGTKCVPCDPTCATCFGGASMQCLTCILGYFYIPWTRECVLYCPWPLITSGATCVSPCSSIDQYIAPDGTTCLSSCSAPYQAITEHTVVKLCINPCSPVEYLYWDGSCQQDCGSPLVVQTTYSNMKVCTYGCTTGQYLYPDGTCGTSCDAPLISRLQSDEYLCGSPCLTGRYLYWNGDCLDSCDLITSVVKGISYCNYPCPTPEYLFWNASCLATCSHPLQIREERGRLYCDYPTDTNEYLYWDGTSSSSCSETWLSAKVEGSPLSRKFCDYTCNSYSYVYWNGSCLEDCPFPLKVTVSNNIPYCEYGCTGSTFLYWNGSCLGTCDSPLTKRTEGGKDFCDYPCLTAQYLYWDGTCSFDCSGYLGTRVEDGRQFCDFPCGSSAKYLYWNGTCKSSCSSPFAVTIYKGMDYCNFKCSGGQYLYFNGSCLDGCDSSEFEPWIVNDVERYCNQASASSDEVDCTNNFYYWNNTCRNECKTPLVQRTVGTQNWCLYPCLVDQFLYPDSRCLDTCNSPFILREELGYKYCDYPCKSTEFAYWNGSCLSACSSPLRSQNTNYGLSCLLPCEASDLYYHNSTGECTEECSAPAISENDAYAICLVTPAVVSDGSFLDIFIAASSRTPSFAAIPYLLQYARFLDIQMPPRLKTLVASKGRGIITLRFGQYMPDDMIATYSSDSSIPDTFRDRSMHSEFIVNFWNELTSWAVIALVILLLGIMESICLLVERWKRAEMVFKKLKVLARWNLPLVVLATSVGDIVFFTILEIISIGNTTAVSVELCLVMLGLIIALVIVGCDLVPTFVVSKRKIILHNSDNNYKSFLKKWESCQILYRGFRDHVSPNGYTYLLYMFRIAFPMFIASVAYKAPIFQAVFYVAFSVAILGYIILKKPVNRKINHIQLIIIETLVLVINFALLLLCILNLTNSQGSSAFVRLGDIVVYGSVIFNVLIVSFLIAKVVNGVIAISNEKDKDRSVWLQLLVFYLQQAGMGFEEIFVDEKAAQIFNQPQHVLEDEKRLIALERSKIKEAKKNTLLNNDEQSSPILNNSERRSTFLKRSAGNEEPEEEEKEAGEGKKGLNLRPQRIEMNSKHKLINETSFSGNERIIRNIVSSKFNLDS